MSPPPIDNPRRRFTLADLNDPLRVDRLAAGGAPLRSPCGLAAEFNALCKPMDPGWRRATARNFWSPLYKGRLEPDEVPLVEFSKALLMFGGEMVCLPAREPDLQALLLRGQVWRGADAQQIEGRHNRCHSNAAELWQDAIDRGTNDTFIATGYALSDDSMWRQHSWCVRVGAGGAPGVIETTFPRVAYFGIALTLDHARDFASANAEW